MVKKLREVKLLSSEGVVEIASRDACYFADDRSDVECLLLNGDTPTSDSWSFCRTLDGNTELIKCETAGIYFVDCWLIYQK